ncbi:heterokaryon incompatibility protein-domain-containing protein [Clohesyomyces aquaticus]|uniref:Heterokaryon incompatibility protein-domain-containing protein n=1 Tax=Clohesyomyces aquaticus TaxID=1231657 RepID=A0A1Y1YH18_9PLEO|nr:heterokaryon incompatibility protein-domain-containing protein [Clohesyomyces aquaticus]
MPLLKINHNGNFSLTRFGPNNIPPYAILSHTWEADEQELTFEEMMTGTGLNKAGVAGYRKIQFCGDQANKDGLEYFWVDSCCIDKTSSAELSESLNSMFRSYSEATTCYVYLSGSSSFDASHDVEPQLRGLRWFQRSWTLQELIAPKKAVLFTATWKAIGTKRSLSSPLSSVTGIPSRVLLLHKASSAQKMEEDMAYCLLGISDISMPPLYGEGLRNAFCRLQEEIIKGSADDSIFA